MREYKKRTRTVEENELVSLTCDLCGRKAKRDGWESSCFEVNETEVEVTVRQKEGTNYPECGSGTKIVVDLCPQCFTGRLVPWLREQGAQIETQNWDW